MMASISIPILVLVVFCSGLLQPCCSSSDGGKDGADGGTMHQLQNCSLRNTPVAGLRLSHDASGKFIVLSTTCWPADEKSTTLTFSSASSSNLRGRIAYDGGVTWSCFNHTVISGLKMKTGEMEDKVNTAERLVGEKKEEKEEEEEGEESGFVVDSEIYMSTSHLAAAPPSWRNNNREEQRVVEMMRGEIEVSSCSHLPQDGGHSLEHCNWTRWLNKPGGNFSIGYLPRPWVVRSVRSHFIKRAHRYKLELCHLTSSSSLASSSSSSSCYLPSFHHGHITSISHTYSIVENHTHFKIGIELSCEEGYHMRRKRWASVCENGTWTQLPWCQKCSDEGCDRAPSITTNRTFRGFVAGSNVTLDCEVKGRPTPKITWHRVLPNGTRVLLQDHTHYVTHNNGSLTIVNVLNYDSGFYVCWARNRLGQDSYHIDLANTYQDEWGPPAIYHWSPLHILTPGHTPTINCHAWGYPPPSISWSFFPLTSSVLSSTSTLLPVTSFSSLTNFFNGTLKFNTRDGGGMSGLYRCEAANQFGRVAMETLVFMHTNGSNKGEAPVINSTNWIKTYTVSVGSRLELHCPTASHSHSPTSSPPIQYYYLWMKKGGRASSLSDVVSSPESDSPNSNSSSSDAGSPDAGSPDAGSRVRQTGNGSLLISVVREEDEGPYWCLVWNHAGVTMETTTIVINNKVSEESVMLPSPTATVAVSSGLNVVCISYLVTLSLSLVSFIIN